MKTYAASFTKEEILWTAMRQSALDLNCEAGDFLLPQNKIVFSAANSGARKYLQLPFDCNLVSYGTNIVASVRPEFAEIVRQYIERYPIEHCFETPNLYTLNRALAEYHLEVCFMAEYFLPDINQIPDISCGFDIRIMEQNDFSDLYVDTWSNALCKDRKHLDVLGAGAYENGRLVGLAGCSADCDTMWQIGVDVLPEYRRRGIAVSLTSHLAKEILEGGKVPFYCAAWSNVKSVRNAIKSGFRPAWAELTVKSKEFTENLLT